MVSSHVDALETKHADLERAIAQENSRPAPDDTMLRQLKLKKLRIKEELASY